MRYCGAELNHGAFDILAERLKELLVELAVHVRNLVRGPTVEQAVREGTGFPVGGVPPIAHNQPLRTFIDQDLLSQTEIWAAAGTPNSVFRISPSDLQAVTNGEVVSF